MLAEIVQVKKEEVLNLVMPERQQFKRRSLIKALNNQKRSLGLIAEVKKASPSKGVIKKDFQPLKIAQEFERGGADAISVLTDERFFQGHKSYLTEIKKEVSLPILRKDFIVSHEQIEESFRIGADAILLIAAILEKNQLHEYYLEAYEKGMECLVEVHSQGELETILSMFKPAILGINNRDLKTFQTNLSHSIGLIKKLPKDIVVVSESGIKSYDHIKQLEGNANAILVGETLMRAETPILGIQQLFGEK